MTALVGAGEDPVEQLALLPAQAVTRTSRTSAADNEPNPLRDADMGHLLCGTGLPMRALGEGYRFNVAHGEEKAGGPLGPPEFCAYSPKEADWTMASSSAMSSAGVPA